MIREQLRIRYGDSAGSFSGVPEAFRRLYFQLYTNSRASRAERIVEDLSLLLLLKLAAGNGDARPLERYLSGIGNANEVLMPVLRRAYPGLVDAKQRFSIGDEAVRAALAELDGIDLSAAPAHVLGEAFQALIGPRLRGDKGQFFTPRSLVRAMVQITQPGPTDSVLDPACGTGGFLMEAHAFQSRSGSASGRLVGIDKDHDLFRLSAALLQIASKSRGRVFNFNSLDHAQWSGTTGDDSFDVVLTNPPFGTKIGVRDERVLQQFALGRQWVLRESEDEWHQTLAVAGAQDPQILFLELCVRKLKPGGRLGIVLPEGVFGNKGEAYVWTWLRTQGEVFALLDCPRTTFQPGTDTKTNVLFFRKHATDPSPATTNAVKIAVALHCGHDRRGRTLLGNGKAHPDNFATLAETFADGSGTGPWRTVRLKVGGYMVPRYYAEQKPVTVQEADLTRDAVTVSLKGLVSDGVLAIRKGHEVGSDSYGTGDIPFVRTSDLANFEISVDPTKLVSEEVYSQYASQQMLKAGDLLMVVDGRYRIGTTAVLTPLNSKCVVQSHLRVISIVKPNRLDPYELLFALNLPSVRLRIRDLVFVQSTLGTLGKRLLELRVPLLHGEGPWKERVHQFRRTLQERDRLLSELKVTAGCNYEL